MPAEFEMNLKVWGCWFMGHEWEVSMKYKFEITSQLPFWRELKLNSVEI